MDQPEVPLLQQVKQKLAAHKAFMITNSGFTAGAEAVAKDEGIALHIVRPDFDISSLPKRGRPTILTKIQEIAAVTPRPIYEASVNSRCFLKIFQFHTIYCYLDLIQHQYVVCLFEFRTFYELHIYQHSVIYRALDFQETSGAYLIFS